MRRYVYPPNSLDNHLGHASAAESLAANERLAANSGKEIAQGSEQEEHGKDNQSAGSNREANPLNGGQDAVGGGAQVVRGDLADKGVKLAGRGADAQQEGYFDEEDKERRSSVGFTKLAASAQCAWKEAV